MKSWIIDYIRGLSTAEYHIQITLLFLFLCFILYKLYKTYHLYRFIDDTPTSKISSAAQGYVELKGFGGKIPGNTTKSPFSGRNCLWFYCKVEKRQKTGKYKNWTEESVEVSDELFILKDDSADCVILPEGAEVIPSEENYWYGRNIQEKYKGNFKSSWLKRYIGYGNYRFTEKLITVADPLYVVGLFKSVAKISESESFHNEVNFLVDSWKRNPEKYLKPFDVDKNEKIQKKEWKKIRQYAVQEIRKRQQNLFINTLKKPNENNHPYIISALSEEHLLKIKYRILLIYLILFLLSFAVFIIALKAE